MLVPLADMLAEQKSGLGPVLDLDQHVRLRVGKQMLQRDAPDARGGSFELKDEVVAGAQRNPGGLLILAQVGIDGLWRRLPVSPGEQPQQWQAEKKECNAPAHRGKG